MSQDVNNPVFKATASIGTAIGAQFVDPGAHTASIFADLLVLTWPNLAGFAAFFYTMTLVIDYWWKKFWRPTLERWGWLLPNVRKTYTAREWAEKMVEQDSEQARL